MKKLISCLFCLLLFCSNNSFASQPKNEDETQNATPEIEYYEMKPFITNLVSRGNTLNYIKVKVVLAIADSRDHVLIEKHSPVIRNSILDILGNETIEDLKGPNGREQLEEKVKQTVIKETDDCIGRRVIKNVLFSEFLVQ
ncbi:MAG: flagellar basal body-associated FliL family protein [Succinivibrionaceae bacterium]